MFKEKSDFKLMMCPVPDSCWYSNLRTILPAKIWDVIRKDAYAKADGRCMICGAKVKRLEAHEDWSYDEVNHIQKLERILALCHNCHSVIHIGRTQLMGDEEKAIRHFCKVNECNYSDYIRALKIANETHQRLNKVSEWKLDARVIEDILTEYDKKANNL
jgi:5-methylcytosine-specific restriction endonuclease McrA